MGSHDHVFSPITIKGIEFKNRIQTAPQVPLMASPEGWVTNKLIEFYRTYARGGFGVVTVGDSMVDFDYAQGHWACLNLGVDDAIGGLNQLAESIFRHGAQVSIEINHSGRNAKSKLLKGKNPIAPSPVPNAAEEFFAMKEGRPPFEVKQINEDQINQVIQNFADAAYRCQTAGFNMVMVHGGHGHLIPQFLSPYSNKRNDRWGGSLENRARFAIAVIDAIRKKCGPNLVIEYRISLDEKVEGGMGPDETIEFLQMIENKIDIIHVSAGLLSNLDTIQYMIQPIYTELMFNVHLAEKVKRNINLPVTTVGSIMNLDNAESIISNGWADFVALGRGALADPEMPRKTAKGRTADVRPCIRCNSCTRRSSMYKQTRCSINPIAGRGDEFPQGEVTPSRVKKKVMVVGGGPAGMQAAQTAVSRGHEVVLYEMSDRLGGLLETASNLPFKGDLRNYYKWMVEQTEKCGCRIVLNTEITADTVKKEEPEALVIAVGAVPYMPNIPGINSDKVVWAGDVDSGMIQVGETVIIIGAGLTGIETAVNLASQGKTVTVIEMMGPASVLSDAPSGHKFYLLDRIKQYGIRIITDTKVEKFIERGVQTINRDFRWVDYEADSVVLAVGMMPRKEKVAELRHLIPATEVHIVGDCSRPRDVYYANHEGFNATCDL